MKKKSAPPKKALLNTIAREMGSVAGTIVNTTRSLAVRASSIVDARKKKSAKVSKRQSKPKGKRGVAKKKRKRSSTA
jgi:prophage tail gpP-like protein